MSRLDDLARKYLSGTVLTTMPPANDDEDDTLATDEQSNPEDYLDAVAGADAPAPKTETASVLDDPDEDDVVADLETAAGAHSQETVDAVNELRGGAA